jgi:hypothetical protein
MANPNSTSFVTCKQCGKTHPATSEYFQPHNVGGRLYLENYCYPCKTERTLRKLYGDAEYETRQKAKQEKQKIASQGMRRCVNESNCAHPDGPLLPATPEYFEVVPKSHTRDGMRGYCRACRVTQSREKNLERYHLQKHNPRVKAQRHLSNLVTISRRRKIPLAFTSSDWDRCLEYWNHRCCICNRPIGLWHTLAREHWIPAADKRIDNPGTVPWNILPMCHSMANGRNGCNNTKNDTAPITWLTRRLGKRAAKKKLAEIETYFDSVRPK